MTNNADEQLWVWNPTTNTWEDTQVGPSQQAFMPTEQDWANLNELYANEQQSQLMAQFVTDSQVEDGSTLTNDGGYPSEQNPGGDGEAVTDRVSLYGLRGPDLDAINTILRFEQRSDTAIHVDNNGLLDILALEYNTNPLEYEADRRRIAQFWNNRAGTYNKAVRERRNQERRDEDAAERANRTCGASRSGGV